MRRSRWELLLLAVPAGLFATNLLAQPDEGSVPGVVVQQVTPGLAAERAGLRPGDLLLGWSRVANPPANPNPARGSVASPFDIGETEIEQAPRGQVTLDGRRQHRGEIWRVPPGDWGLTTQVVLSGELSERLATADSLVAAQKPKEAAATYRELARQGRDSVSPAILAWLKRMEFVSAVNAGDGEASCVAEIVSLLESAGRSHLATYAAANLAYWLASVGRDASAVLQMAGTRVEPGPPSSLMAAAALEQLSLPAMLSGDLAGAEGLAESVVVAREKLAPGSLVVAASLNNLGVSANSRGDLAAAEDFYRRSLAIEEKLAPGSLDVATRLNNLGNVANSHGDLAAAEDFYRRSLAIKEKLAPGSLDVAMSLNNRGSVANSHGDLAAAEDFYRRSLAIQEKLAPESLDVAASLNNLGNTANSRGDLAAAEDFHRRALAIKEKLALESLDVAASLNNLGNTANSRGDLAAAEDLYRRSLAITEKLAPGSLDVAASLNNLGSIADSRGDLATAEDFHRRALAIKEKLAPGSLDVAASLNNLGNIADSRGDLATAEDFHRRALAIKEKLAPGSLDVAASLNNLGNIANSRGDLAAAEDFHRRSLVIQEKLAPGSLDVASSLNNLGSIANSRGDLAAAEDFHRRSLVIQEKLAPGSLDVARSLNNLGNIADSRGDLAAAEDFYRRSLAIKAKLAPGSLGVAASLNNLGNIADGRGDLAAAEDLYRRSLAIKAKLAPGSLDVAASLNNLGSIADSRGDLAAAKDFHRRALAIKEKLAPGSLDVAASLSSLGSDANSRGDLAAAEHFHRRALAIREKLAPGSLDIAASLNSLGSDASSRGDLAAAEGFHHRALAILEKLAPGGLGVARSLNSLGHVARQRGDKPTARSRFCAAVDALEVQRAKLGGTQEARSGFSARYASFYRDCQDALLDLGEPEDALHVLERSRARSLLEMLAERDVLFTLDLPLDLARERTLTDTEYERTQARLAQLVPSRDGPEIERRLTQLSELRQKQDEIASRIRQVSPRFASLQYPMPLDLAAIRTALDPGTLFLAFSVGTEHTTLFAVQPAGEGAGTGLSVFTIPVGEGALREKVEAFRNLIRRGAPVRNVGGELYDLLLKPAEGLISSSQRLLISPDGPLHVLPFAALTLGEPQQYLVEWKPLHFAVSATVYAELKNDRKQGPSGPVKVVAFGDPLYPSVKAERSSEVTNLELRSFLGKGVAMTPLPGTRQEVEALAELYPNQSVKYLGAEATEERAKGLAKDARYVHFACHGLLDERFPLNSALALTVPEDPGEGQENGLLQAWEVFERVRLDAELVGLSACETGLGKEMGGEGLVGLTRAFQYAGARSVLASLWSVSDESTVGLMKAFYGGLKSGKSKDEALRDAQLNLLKDGKTAQPFHWAAFQITGDWR